MESHITQAEQNLTLLHAMIPANEQFYVWCFTRDGHCLGTSCPAEDRPLLERAFHRFGGWAKALAAAEAGEPRLIGSPIGLQWAVTFEAERRGSLVFVAGPAASSAGIPTTWPTPAGPPRCCAACPSCR